MVKVIRQIVSNSVAGKVTYNGKNKVNYITVHQTGNTSKGANAKVHANLQSNGNARSASWHYQVDDKEAYQSFEDDAQCWHAGDGQGPGNTQSVAVEICINSDGNYKKSVQNGAELVKQLLDKHNLSIDKVKQHADWSNKNCPAQIRGGKDGIKWADFIKMVEGKSTGGSGGGKSQPEKPKQSKSKTVTGKWATIQTTLNSRYSTGLAVDNIPGPLTFAAIVKGVQTELNRQFNAGLAVDGIPGPKTRAAYVNVRPGSSGNLTWLLQASLLFRGHDPGKIDGVNGTKTQTALKAFQRARKLTVDGIAGRNTWSALLG